MFYDFFVVFVGLLGFSFRFGVFCCVVLLVGFGFFWWSVVLILVGLLVCRFVVLILGCVIGCGWWWLVFGSSGFGCLLG